MAVYKRKETGTWFYKFMIKGVTYRESIPEAGTKRQAEHVERLARQDVFEGRYGKQAGTESFVKFVQEVYLPWARENKRSFTSDEWRCQVLCEYFKGKALRDITPMLIEKYKRERHAAHTRYGRQRSSASVNHEMAVLSRVMTMACDN